MQKKEKNAARRIYKSDSSKDHAPKKPSVSKKNLTIKVTGLNEYGEGTAKQGKQTWKFSRTVPGDLVQVKAPEEDKAFVRAEVLNILQASENRLNPACPSFSEGCGGCQWLHIEYPVQLEWKRRIVADFLDRRSGLKPRVLPVLGMTYPEEDQSAFNPRAYRNKMSLNNENGRLGFLKEYSHDLVYMKSCQAETKENQEVWLALKDRTFPPEILQVHLRSSDKQVGLLFFVKKQIPELKTLAQNLMKEIPLIKGIACASYRSYEVLAGCESLEQRLGSLRFLIPHNGFFQTNYAQALVLQEEVLKLLDPQKKDRILDLYCGAGFFALALAGSCKEVLGIENSSASIENAWKNSELNQISNVNFVCKDAGFAFADEQVKKFKADLVVLDPPREGCGPGLISGITRKHPRKIVYVSCYLESLSRDLKDFRSQGYLPSLCQPVDLFPHTFHVENIVVLEAQN